MCYTNSSDPYADAQGKLSRLESLASDAEKLQSELDSLSRSAPNGHGTGGDQNALMRAVKEHQSRVLVKQRELDGIKSNLGSLVTDLEGCASELEGRSQNYQSDAEMTRRNAGDAENDARSDMYDIANEAKYKSDERRSQADDIRAKINSARSRVARGGSSSFGNVGLDGMVGTLYSSLGRGRSGGGNYTGGSYNSSLGAVVGSLFGARPSRYKKGYKSKNFTDGMDKYYS